MSSFLNTVSQLIGQSGDRFNCRNFSCSCMAVIFSNMLGTDMSLSFLTKNFALVVKS